MKFAALEHLEIPKNLLLTRHLPLRKKIELAKRFLLYKKTKSGKSITIDISAVCNAKCYYCSTGLANRNHTDCKPDKAFMEVDVFEKILHDLKRKQFLTSGTYLELFTFYEPLLHPEFSKIIEIATREDCLIGLSTNGNVLPKIPENFDASHITEIILSMPGFSQASYDKIHQFDFERIKHNMAWLVKTFRQHGCVGRIHISFHVYQFNLHELTVAYDFAKQLGIFIRPIFAYVACGTQIIDYLKRTLPVDYLYHVSQDLFMGLWTKDLAPTTTCALTEKSFPLSISASGECRLCCLQNEPIGNVFEMTREKLATIRKSHKICQKCMQCGLPALKETGWCDMKQVAKAFQR